MHFRCRSSRTPRVRSLEGRALLSAAGAVLVLAAGCRSAAPPGPVVNRPAPSASPLGPPGLPPVPAIVGAALVPRVQYPSDNQVISARDSNFVLGSVGSGDARLSINGRSVPLAPNGAFLAWLPIPPASAPRYDLMVTRGTDTVRQTVRVRYPTRLAIPATGPLLVDSSSLSPTRGVRAVPGEWLRVSVRAAGNARVHVELADGTKRPMVPLARLQASALLAASGQRDPIAPESAPTGDDVAATFATDVAAAALTKAARVVVVRGSDSALLIVPVVEVPAPNGRLLGVLRSRNTVGSDTDQVVNARTIPDGTYKWLLLPGTVLEVTGRQNGATRVRLDDALDVWVASEDIVALPDGSAMPGA